MEAHFIRRAKLGRGSTKGIISYSKHIKSQTLNPASIPEDSLCIRWGCTANVPTKNVLNSAKAIHTVNNKKSFRYILQEHDLCPKTFEEYEDMGGWEPASEKVIIRPAFHAQGKHITVLEGFEILDPNNYEFPYDYYISEFIEKVAEYRVFVCQGRVVWVANKIPADPNDVAWNVAQGGKFENVKWSDWNTNVLAHAVKAMYLSGLDFGGVDIIVDKYGIPYVLEINSAPSQTSPYRQQCVAKVFDYIVENGKETISLGSSGKYLRYIHPAIEPKAIVL